jgi:YVTN family beta-propeller protein
MTLALALASCQNKSPAPPAPEKTAQVAPPMPVTPSLGRLYVSNEESGDISVIDLATEAVTATIQVGKRPRGVRISPDRRWLYVALSGSPKAPQGQGRGQAGPPDRSADGLGAVDLGAGKLARVLPSGQDPESFDISPDGAFLYVSNEETAEASIVDIAKGKIEKSLPTGGEPEGVAVRPDGKYVYVTSELDSAVVVIDPVARKIVTKFAVGTRPRGVLFSPDGKSAFVTAELGGTVTFVDAEKNVPVRTVDLRKGADPNQLPLPMGIALSPDGKTLFVSVGRGRKVFVLDAKTGEIAGTVAEVGTRPWGIAVSPDGKKVYTANGPSNDVSVIDVASRTITKRIPVGKGPWGLVLLGPPPAP